MSILVRRLVSRSRDGKEILRLAHAESRRRPERTVGKSATEKVASKFENSLSSETGRRWGRSSPVSPGFSAQGCKDRRVPSGFAPGGPKFYSAGVAAPEASQESHLTRGLTIAGLLCASAAATYYFYPRPATPRESEAEVHTVSNWSNTHETKTQVYLQPESLEELEKIVELANERKQKIRPVGSGLSPNGIGLCSEGMVNLALMDRILDVDEEKMQVTVQAGARVEQVVEALKPYGLTLQNFASIKEQQIGGFIQVGAHGTGATLPPVDEQVVSIKLVTPGKGTLDLSAENQPELFYLSRCALGAVGVVAEVTLQCVPRHRLLEYTFVTDMKGVKQNHKKWLSQNKHLRYMWIPDTDSVVVVQCNPLAEGKEAPRFNSHTADEKLKYVRDFYRESVENYGLAKLAESSPKETGSASADEKAGMWSGTGAATDHSPVSSEKELSELSFTEMRDILISLDPLNREHIMKVNKVEAQYWKLSEGYRTGYNDEILGFDCGGQQWVSETAFPVGTLKKPNLNDIKYMEELLKLIQRDKIPAPAPIEQRWTAGSKSFMSPAHADSADAIFSWVGIIMYLPTAEEAQRKAITRAFMDYRKASQLNLWEKYHACEHWAKIEIPEEDKELEWLQKIVGENFPVDYFNEARQHFDPNHVLSNDAINRLFRRDSGSD